MTFTNGEVASLILTHNQPSILKVLQEHLGEPVDSYWNGSHTWFSVIESDDSKQDKVTCELEWRLHPVSGFTMPEASRPEDLYDLALEGEVDIEHYWEGLEVFVISEESCTPEDLSAHVSSKLGIDPDASGTVDHDTIGNTFERARGEVSIVSLLLEQLKASGK